MAVLFLLVIIFFLFSFTPISASQSCFPTSCQSTEPIIRFPFHLKTLQPTCGFPGFTLFCDAFNQTRIGLPNSGSFAVRAIDYARQNIWLNDPDNCLPRRLLELNLSGSPFHGAFFQDFTLFRCASFDHKRYSYTPIRCLNDDNYTVFATSSERVAPFLASRCTPMETVAVPVKWDFFEPVRTSDLSEDIRLTWSTPRCGRCEKRGGKCGFSSANSTVVECSHVSSRRLPKTARYAIIVGAGVPAFFCLLGFICFLSSRLRRWCCRRRHHQPLMEFSMAVAPQPTTVRTGLDAPTIDSYPKTVLGDSCRLPNPDDSICSICLSEYVPKDTLRSIPQCQHCFHADCIDKWLRQNPSCPICRNSPKPSPLNSCT